MVEPRKSSRRTEKKPHGRPSRGDRHWVNSGLPESQYEIYAQKAGELDISMGSYVTLCMAEFHNLEQADYIKDELRAAELRRANAQLVDLEEVAPMARAG